MRKLTSRRAIKKLHMPHKVLLKAFEGKEAECIEAVKETVENENNSKNNSLYFNVSECLKNMNNNSTVKEGKEKA